MTTGKTIALTRRTFVGKVMSLFFNMLSRLVITFLPRGKRLLISWLQSPSAVILEPKNIKSATVSTVSPSISHEVMGPDAMILVFWMLNFKPIFSLSSFTFTLLQSYLFLQSMGFASHLSLNLSLICFMFLDTLERNFHLPEVSWKLRVCKKLLGNFRFKVLIIRRKEGSTRLARQMVSQGGFFFLPFCSLLLPLSSPPLCPFLLCPERTQNRFYKGIHHD